jgi:hypothetical protein
MDGKTIAPDADFLIWCLQQAGVPCHKLRALRPDFLVISPPKTGSTWLAECFRRHGQLYVPDIKEVKYFSSFFNALDLSWYLDQFAPAGGRLKGEASPSYSLLPIERVRLIHRLMPDVKLIFLMRDPISRAWSHARHNFRYHEANFAGYHGAFDDVPTEQWCANFAHDWPLGSGDYLGQLQRWLAVFPREQIHVGFYESIGDRPEALLRELFSFLGVDGDVDLSGYPLRERILEGLPAELPPALERALHGLLHERTVELVDFLEEQFDLEPPEAWKATLAPAGRSLPTQPEVFRRALDDDCLLRLLAEEEAFPSARCDVIAGYRGYDIVLHQGMLYALDRSIGTVRVELIPEADLRRHQQTGACVVASSLRDVKERVEQQVLERTQRQMQESRATLQLHLTQAFERIALLEARMQEAERCLRRVEADLYPWPVFAAVHLIRQTWRKLRDALLPAHLSGASPRGEVFSQPPRGIPHRKARSSTYPATVSQGNSAR